MQRPVVEERPELTSHISQSIVAYSIELMEVEGKMRELEPEICEMDNLVTRKIQLEQSISMLQSMERLAA